MEALRIGDSEPIVVGEGILDLWASYVSFGSWDIVYEKDRRKIVLSCTDGEYVYDSMEDAIADATRTVLEWIKEA